MILSSSSPPLLQTHSKPLKSAIVVPTSNSNHLHIPSQFRKSSLSFTAIHLFSPSLPSLAAETPADQVSDKINLESVLVSIDDFFTRYPFFVSGCLFIWLVVIPVGQQYLRKYRYLSAIDAFRKLRDNSEVQLLDIRDEKSVEGLGSPNLKILNKSVVQVEFVKDVDEDGFVKKVLGKFREPANTVLCILDNADDNSLRAAELLVKNGFKEAYAIKGGVRGKKGWVAIQKTMLPPSVGMFSKNKASRTSVNDSNGAAAAASVSPNQKEGNGRLPVKAASNTRVDSRSPYPNYPDLKPPSSPIPSKPGN
ncbi:unnamed protein product [Linum trigynum]